MSWKMIDLLLWLVWSQCKDLEKTLIFSIWNHHELLNYKKESTIPLILWFLSPLVLISISITNYCWTFLCLLVSIDLPIPSPVSVRVRVSEYFKLKQGWEEWDILGFVHVLHGDFNYRNGAKTRIDFVLQTHLSLTISFLSPPLTLIVPSISIFYVELINTDG